MKRALFIVTLASGWSMAAGPKYMGPTAPLATSTTSIQGIWSPIYQEFQESYRQIGQVPNSIYKSSSMTLQGITVDSVTVNKTLYFGDGTTQTTAPPTSHLAQLPLFCSETTGSQTTSSSFVNAALTCSITPTSSTDRIFGVVAVPGFCNATGKNMNLGVSGTATGDIYTTGNTPGRYHQYDGTGQGNVVTFIFLDVPASASQQTYTLRIASVDGLTTCGVGGKAYTGADTTMILLDVK